MEIHKIIRYKTIDSTNMEAERIAKRGAEHGTVVLAKEQTAGKGRRGREWESPAGENIYMSILLRPELQPSKAPMLTLVMAYSVAKVLKAHGFDRVQIKWPNDLILAGRKICGILTEMRLSENKIDYVIVGVGINVNTPSFPSELSDKATSLLLESGKKQNMETLLEDICREFGEDYETFTERENLSFLAETYNAMLVNRDTEVRVLEPGNEYMATALGINDVGELIVRTKDGEQRHIYAGEVSVRGVYGYV